MSKPEQPTSEIDPAEIVTAYLEREREAWLPAYQRKMRADGMNAQANAEAAEHMKRIDPLLDELARLGSVAVGAANVTR